MTGFSTRWVVRLTEQPRAEDVDAAGFVSETALWRWIERACDAYLDECPGVRAWLAEPGHVVRREVVLPGRLHSDLGAVAVSARATEVWPAAFRISVRLRAEADAGVDAALDASCVLAVQHADTGEGAELGTAIRDELIALEHTARHFN